VRIPSNGKTLWELSQLLLSQILQYIPGFKRPDLQRWAKPAQRICGGTALRPHRPALSYPAQHHFYQQLHSARIGNCIALRYISKILAMCEGVCVAGDDWRKKRPDG
jgi:hypothetical protein